MMKCSLCGSEFIQSGNCQKYCSDKCAAVAKNNLRRIRRLGQKQSKVCLGCGGIFVPVTTSQQKSFPAFDAHSLNTDPLLVNPGSGQFWLQGTSPCFRAGTPADIVLSGLYPGTAFSYANVPSVPPGNPPNIGAYTGSELGAALLC